MPTVLTIELKQFLSQENALVGRANGEALQSKLIKAGYEFVKMETDYEQIKIVIPEKIVTINKSYFLGLFETVVQRLGRNAFLDKYVFVSNEYILSKIRMHVEAALLKASPGDILDV